jgi:hypothetical protein
MNFFLRFLCLGLVFLIWQCTQPIRRTTVEEKKNQNTVQTPIPNVNPDDLADLRKPVWIFEFKNESQPESRSLKKIPLSNYLQEAMLEAFSTPKSPFTVQSKGEEKMLMFPPEPNQNENSEIPESLKNNVVEPGESQNIYDLAPEILAKNLRGSDVSGFLLGKIVSFKNSIDGEKSEGILKLKTLSLEWNVTYELIDTSTGKIVARGREKEIYSESRSDFLGIAPEMTDLPVKVRKMAQNLSEKIMARMAPFSVKLAWGGRVLKIEGGRLYINAGRKAGLVLGDTLRIVERSREIIDPQSGKIIGEAPGRVKGTFKLIQFFGTDGAIGVLQSGGGAQPGDRVELY